MANEDEIIQQFKVVDAGATAALGKIAASTKEVSKATHEADGASGKHGEGVEKLGKQLVGLGHHHTSARHAVRLFAEATGVGTGGIMTLVHSMGMMGPELGGAVGGFIRLKQAMDAEAEAAKAAKDHTDALIESVMKYTEARKER